MGKDKKLKQKYQLPWNKKYKMDINEAIFYVFFLDNMIDKNEINW